MLGQAHLIPYKSEKLRSYICTFVPGWKGIISVIGRSGKGYVQYEILGGGTGGRAGRDGLSGACANQSNARIAPVEIIEA